MASSPERHQPASGSPPALRWKWRWLAVWLLLLGVDLAVWSLSRRLLAGRLWAGAEDLLELLLIPPAQAGALLALLAMRR